MPTKEFTPQDYDKWFKYAKQGNISQIRKMVSEGIDVNRGNQGDEGYDSPALYYACEKGYIDIVRFLLKKEADINKSNFFETTPIAVACWEGHIDTVRYLLSKGAKMHTEVKKQPLNNAVWNNHLDIIKLLHENGLKLYKEKDEEPSHICLAASFGHLEIVKYFLANGVDINEKDGADGGGRTPIIAAARVGNKDMVQFLLLAGANPFLKNKNNADALEVAKNAKNNPAAKVSREDMDKTYKLIFQWINKEDEI